MKKTFIGPLLTVMALVIVIALFIYFHVTLNRMDQKLLAIRNSILEDSNKTTAIVNFFNANLNAQNNKK